MSTISAFFKRILAFVLAAASVVLPLQRSVGDVKLTVPELTTATTQVEVIIENNGGSEISYGLDSFSLEKKTLLGWKTLQKSGDYVVAAVLLTVAPGESARFHVHLPLVYGKTLDAGVYRFNLSYYGSGGDRSSASKTFSVKR